MNRSLHYHRSVPPPGPPPRLRGSFRTNATPGHFPSHTPALALPFLVLPFNSPPVQQARQGSVAPLLARCGNRCQEGTRCIARARLDLRTARGVSSRDDPTNELERRRESYRGLPPWPFLVRLYASLVGGWEAPQLSPGCKTRLIRLPHGGGRQKERKDAVNEVHLPRSTVS
jgi:hypothetical protein